MKQVTQSMKDGRIEVLDVPPPSCRPQGILVRTAWSLISAGTEGAKVDMGQKSLIAKARSRPDQAKQVLAKVRQEGVLRTYRTVKTRLEEKNAIGYSSAGIVTEVGELAPGLAVGDKVACGGAEYANHAEYAYVPATLCARVPEGVSLDQAAFATVGAVALQGVRQSGVTVGDRVAVIGLGLLGQITVQLLRAAGCEVAGSDPDSVRCAMALKSGALIATSDSGSVAARRLSAATGELGYDAVIITAGTKSDGPVRLAGEICRDRGTVVVVGDVGMRVPRPPFYEKELTLKLSRSYGPGRYDPTYEEMAIDYPPGYVRWTEQRNMAEFLRLVAEGLIDMHPLISHRFAVDDAASAYATISGGGGSLGVLLEYPGGEPERSRIYVARAAGVPTPVGSIGVSFIGAGNFATSTLLPALAADPRFRAQGVCTPSGLSARDVADRAGFSYSTHSADEILADPDTRAVVIATRHESHASIAVQALEAGKVVFVEKPLAMTETELDEVLAAQLRTEGRLTVGFNRRFAVHTRRMLEALARRTTPANIVIRVNAGAIPPTHWIQRAEEGGGRIVGEVCHFVDLASCLAASRPTRVIALSAGAGKPPLLRDDLSVLLTFADGSVATVVYTSGGDTAYGKERVEVFNEGTVVMTDDFRRLALTWGGRVQVQRSTQMDKGHAAEMRAFLDLAAGSQPQELTFADCVASMAATFKVVESLSLGSPVAVPDVSV
jgi:predicted dehydrogenase/threonine dehydrogenase-like Zn-dependent dehydrogenase